VARRLDEVHRPYHQALGREMRAVRARFGAAVLLDCHSMPPPAPGSRTAAIVLGDRHGASISEGLLAVAEAAIRGAGFEVARNVPYAGGHITERHGRPGRRLHALQLEIDRSLYLAPDLRSPGPGFERVAMLIAAVTQALATALQPPHMLAAE